jgi:hypothetical protein
LRLIRVSAKIAKSASFFFVHDDQESSRDPEYFRLTIQLCCDPPTSPWKKGTTRIPKQQSIIAAEMQANIVKAERKIGPDGGFSKFSSAMAANIYGLRPSGAFLSMSDMRGIVIVWFAIAASFEV